MCIILIDRKLKFWSQLFSSSSRACLHLCRSFACVVFKIYQENFRRTDMGDGRSDNSAEFHRENSTNSDSIGLTTSIAMDIYKQRLPRRRKKASDGCWGLTCHSWLFLLLAFLQGMCMRTPTVCNGKIIKFG